MSEAPMRAVLPVLLAAALAVVGCDAGRASNDAGGSLSEAVAAAATTTTAAPAAPAADARIAARTKEIVDPDKATMVLLYIDLAGIRPAIDDWAEQDPRVQFAPPLDKAARRASVRAELTAAFDAVRDVGRIRISLADAGLSEYDPSYGEFTVRALGPASELVLQALGQKVATRFVNAPTAQLWRVPAAAAQGVRDRIAGRAVGLDAVLRVVGVQPGLGGGALLVHVDQYALRAFDGTTLARIP